MIFHDNLVLNVGVNKDKNLLNFCTINNLYCISLEHKTLAL